MELGNIAKDKITGFSGVVMGRAQYLTGCDQYLIQPRCETELTYPEGQWFDEGRLQVTDTFIVAEDIQGEKPGCDYKAPVK